MNQKHWKKQLSLLLAACLLLAQGLALAQPLEQDPTYLYMVRRAEMVHGLGRYFTWPLEQKAALDAYRISLGLAGPSEPVHTTPQDMPREQALSLAYDVIEERAGRSRDQLAHFHVEYSFLASQDGSLTPYWRLLIQDTQNSQETPPAFFLEIESPSGQVRTWEERASLMVDIPPEPLTLQPGDIPLEQAVQAAFEYALAHYDPAVGMTSDILKNFNPNTVLLGDSQDGGRSYWIEFNPLDDQLFDYFGPYSVWVDAQSGEVLEGSRGNG